MSGVADSHEMWKLRRGGEYKKAVTWYCPLPICSEERTTKEHNPECSKHKCAMRKK